MADNENKVQIDKPRHSTVYVSGGDAEANVENAPKTLESTPTQTNATVNAGSEVASAEEANAPKVLSTKKGKKIETEAGSFSDGVALVANEAKTLKKSSTEPQNINQTDVRVEVNDEERSLKVTKDASVGRYVEDTNTVSTFAKEAPKKNEVNPVTIDDVKRLIKKYGGNPDVYTKEEIDEIVATIREGQYVEVSTTEYPTLESFLESEGEQGTVYLYPVGNVANNYYQYIWEGNHWVPLGTTQIDLSNYPRKDQAETITGVWTFGNGITTETINKNTSGYGLTLPNTASLTADKELATTDQFKVKANESIIGDQYDSDHVYNSGDICIKDNVLYKCNTNNTTGTWDSSKWDATTVAELVADETIIRNAFTPYDGNTIINDVYKNEIRVDRVRKTLSINLICQLTTTNANYTFNIPNIINELFLSGSWYNGIISFVGTVWVASPFALYFYRVSGTEWRCGVSAQQSAKWICIQQTVKY